jgi:flagellar biosynthesis/type III secretory pathway protein FliH
MDTKAKHEYDAYMKDVSISKSMLATAKIEGREEGREQGREEKNKSIVISLFKEKMEIAFISRVTGLNEIKVLEILKASGLK